MASWKAARERAAELLNLPAPPTAIFCYNDMTALGAIEAVQAAGLRVGREVSVVGFDDLFFAASLQPPLTSFRQPKKELGKQAMQLLLAILKGQPARTESGFAGRTSRPRIVRQALPSDRVGEKLGRQILIVGHDLLPRSASANPSNIDRRD